MVPADYIHRSREGFYKHYGSDMMGVLRGERESNYLNMMTRYQRDFANTVKGVGALEGQNFNQIMGYMNASLSPQPVLDTITEELNKTLKNELEGELSKAATVLNSAAAEGRKAGFEYVANIRDGKTRTANKTLSNLLQNISDASIVAYGGDNTLAKVLNGVKTTGQLEKAIERRMRALEGKKVSMSKSNEDEVLMALNRFIKKANGRALPGDNNIITMGEDGKVNVRWGSVLGTMSGIFNTQMGESMIGGIINNGLTESLSYLKDGVMSIGSQNVSVAIDPAIAQAEQTKYKVDNSLPGFKTVITMNGKTAELSIDLGLSIKNYKDDDHVTVTTELTALDRRLENLPIFNTGSFNKTAAYNIIANADELKNEYAALKSNFVAGFADIFISGVGVGGDLSHYIVVNGKFYPIYEVLKLHKDNETLITVQINGVTEVYNMQKARRADPLFPADKMQNIVWNEKGIPMQRGITNSKAVMQKLKGMGFSASLKVKKLQGLLN